MNKPLWSVMIPTYNSAQYLAETLESVLAQNYSEEDMEIVVVDNCSTDHTKAIVENVGKGRVVWMQNPANIGAIGNFNECINLAKGELIHILNSDDLVKLGYYHTLANTFDEYQNIGLVSCAIEVIDDDGNFLHNLPLCYSLSQPTTKVSELLYDNLLRTPAIAVRHSVYESIGGFDPTYPFAADWEMWVRAITACGGMQIANYLCQYRQNASGETAKVAATSREILDRIQVMEKFNTAGYAEDKKKYKSLVKNTAFYQYNNFPENNSEKITIIKAIYFNNSNFFDRLRDLYLSRIIRKIKFSF